MGTSLAEACFPYINKFEELAAKCISNDHKICKKIPDPSIRLHAQSTASPATHNYMLRDYSLNRNDPERLNYCALCQTH